MPSAPQLSIVLPCYNESRGLETILNRFAEVGAAADFELILVDNGSRDETPAVLKTLLPKFPFARSVRVDVNQGYGHGIHTGLLASRGEILAWSHADLQTDPADVFRALAVYRQSRQSQATFVKGVRYGRRLSERVISLGMGIVASAIFRCRLSEINAQPKLFHRSLMEQATNPPIDFNYDVYMLVQAKQAGCRLETISVKFPPRQYGHSNWARTWKSKLRTIWRSVKYMVRLAMVGDGTVIDARSRSVGQTVETKGAPGVKRPHLLNHSSHPTVLTKRV
ncbi:MAG: glycosyltransferase family 2 protein [Pirellulales bacterium]|nr:glycosyltransferase family 2 protein [Pirellulales bacterium]